MNGLDRLKNLLGQKEKGKASNEPTERISVPADTTLFHITHWKSGSQWVRAILEDLYGLEATVGAEYFGTQLWNRPIEREKVYTGVCIGEPEFRSLQIPAKTRRIFVLRDLRDTLVSAYFSLRYSHANETAKMDKVRQILSRFDEEAGLNYLMETWLHDSAYIQYSWLKAGEPFFRLEDCMTDELGALERMFRDGWGISVDRQHLVRVLSKRSYEKMAGRKRGEEDSKAHYRKGVAGDWKLHFTPAITNRFKVLYNDVLMAGGYEQNEDWSGNIG